MTPAKNYPATVEEALEVADRHPDAECWRRYRRKVLRTPEPFSPRFVERFAATAVEDPATFAQIGAYVLRAAQQQEVEL